jgi:NTE family protein
MTVQSLLRRPRQRSGPGPTIANALVLSGGGSLGAIQVGAVRALLEAGIRPDVYIGCSVGALNAAFLAMDPDPARIDLLEALWLSLDRADVFPSSRRAVATHVIRRDAHLYESDGLHSLVRRWVPASDLGMTKVPCHVVTTDLGTGSPCWWTAGDPHQVLIASASLPGLFPPVAMGNALHVDGGVTCPVPLQRALDLGAARIWVIDVTGGSIGRRDARMNALDVLLMSFAVSRRRLATLELAKGELARGDTSVVTALPQIDVGPHELRNFGRTAEFIQLGYEAGQQMMARAAVHVKAR